MAAAFRLAGLRPQLVTILTASGTPQARTVPPRPDDPLEELVDGLAPRVPKSRTWMAVADESVARSYDGAGLGLPLTRELCHLMGGRLLSESTPGVGSTFTIVLPRRTRAA